MEASFPVDEMRTYRRASFTEEELQAYLVKHFQRLDLLPLIENNYAYKLNGYFHSGNWLNEIGLTAESISSYKAALSYYHSVEDLLTAEEKDDIFNLASYAHATLAENYARLSFLDSAAIYLQKNIDFTKENGTVYYPSAINNYGLFYYWRKHELDTALKYFNTAYEITGLKFKDHYLIGSIRDNIADVYLEEGKTDRAAQLYKANFEFFKHSINEDLNTRDIPRLISAGAQHIEAALKQKETGIAYQTYLDLKAIVNDPQNQIKQYPNSKLEFLKAQSALLFEMGRLEEAYRTENQINLLSDSLFSVSKVLDKRWLDATNKVVMDRVKLNFELEKAEKEHKIKNQRLKLWIISLAASAILMLLVFLYYRRRQGLINARNQQLLAEKTLENTNLKNHQLQFEIKSKQRDLTDFAINLAQNREWAEVLARKIDKLKATKGRQRKKLMDAFELEIRNKVNFDTENMDFYERLDKLSNSFYLKLRSEFPDLSKTDKILCSLIRLKIGSNEIARLQNITLASLNSSRYRLRKKFGLPKNVSLDDYIQSL